MDGSTNIELDIDHGITFLLCLFGHDVQHDLYHGHGTGKPRAVATFNNEMGGIDIAGPGRALLPRNKGGGIMKGGLKNDDEDIITVQTEVEKCLEIGLALKYAKGIIAEYYRNIFLTIVGRSATNGCQVGEEEYIVYIDLESAMSNNILEPGRIAINNNIIDPFELSIEDGTTPDGSQFRDYNIFSGDYEGYTLRLLDTGRNQLILQIFINGQYIQQLNAVYGECIDQGLLDQISERCINALQNYITAQNDRDPEADPNPELGSFNNYIDTQRAQGEWPDGTLFYKIATSGILPLIVENISGVGLVYELFKSPENMSMKIPEEEFYYYKDQMGTFIQQYITALQQSFGTPNPDINILKINSFEAGKNILDKIAVYSGYDEDYDYENDDEAWVEIYNLFSASLEGFLIDFNVDKPTLEMLNNYLKQISEATRDTPGQFEVIKVSLFAILTAVNNVYSQSLSNEIIQGEIELSSPAVDAEIDNWGQQQLNESNNSREQAVEESQIGGAIFDIEPIYNIEVCNPLVQTIERVASQVVGKRAAAISTDLGFKNPDSIINNTINSVGGSFQNIPKEMSQALSEGKLFSNPPRYNPSLTKIKQNNIPEKKCLTRPDLTSAENLLSIIGEMIDLVESVGRDNLDVVVQQVIELQNKLMAKIFNNEENPTIDMPLKTCTTIKGKEKKYYVSMITAFQNIRSMIYIFATLIAIATKRGTWYIDLLQDPSVGINWLVITQKYIEDLVEIFKLVSITTGPKVGLTNVAKANNGFVVGSCSAIALAITQPLLQFSSNRALGEISYAEEEKMLQGQISRLQNAAGAPDDTRLVKSIKQRSSFYNYYGTLISKWPAAEIKGVRTDMLTDMQASGLNGQTIQTMVAAGQKKYFVNNAVSLGPQQLGPNVYKRNFCPISSIVDAQTTVCNSLKIAKNDGYEYGIQDVTIYSNSSDGTSRLFTYRVRVVPIEAKSGVPSKIAIAAYLQVMNDVFINMAPVAALTQDWPGVERSPESELLGNISLDDPNSPLSARKCLFDLQLLFDNPNSLVGQLANYTDVIDVISNDDYDDEDNPPPPEALEALANVGGDRRMMMKQILEVSFRKALGDYLQELSTVAAGGGYVDGTYSQYPAGVILDPNTARLGLHNDRPAFARAMLLSLYGKSGVNPHSLSALTVTDNLDRLNYIAAGRNLNVVGEAAGGRGRKRKTVGRKKVKRGKQTKRNRRKSKK
jgi:hypothetical protein